MRTLSLLLLLVSFIWHIDADVEKPLHYFFTETSFPSSSSSRRLTDLWTRIYHSRIETYPAAAHFWNQLSSLHQNKLMMDRVGLSDSLSCPDCQTVANRVMDLSLAGKSTAEIKAIMATECYTMFPNPEDGKSCESSASFMLLLGPSMVEKATKMYWNAEAFCAGWLTSCTIDCCESDAPEQVRLSLYSDFSSIGVTWLQRSAAPLTVTVATESGETVARVKSVADTYTGGGWIGNAHNALLAGLKCGTRYNYYIDDATTPSHARRAAASARATAAFSSSFRTPACGAGVTSPLRLAHVADIDYDAEASRTAALLAKLAAQGELDAVLLVGDVGYADGYERHNDMFGRVVSMFGSRVPVLACPGNHEVWGSFEAYKTRFPSPACDWKQVPRKQCQMHYSITMGPLHVQMLNGESSIDTPYIDDEQRAWAGNDVVGARNRSMPWVISAIHRPVYSSTNNREGRDYARYLRSRLEDVYAAGAVDAVLTGHIHAYERSHPVRNEVVTDRPQKYSNVTLPALPAMIAGGATPMVYRDASAPVYVVNGVGGSLHERSLPECDQEYCAVASQELGFGLLTVQGNVMRYDYVHTDTADVHDTFVIVK